MPRSCGIRAGRLLIAGALPAAALLRMGVAFAQDGGARGLEVDWVAPGECPTRGWVEAEVMRVAGAGGKVIARQQFKVRAAVRKAQDGRYNVVVSTIQGGWSGTRELDAASCEELASSTALIVGMMLQSSGPPAEMVPSPPPPSADRPTPIQTPRESAPSQRWRGFAGPVFAGNVGLLPGVSYALGAVLGARFGETRVELSGLYAPDTRGTASATPGAEGQFRLISVGASVCPSLLRRPMPVGFCVSVDWQRVIGRGVADAASFANFHQIVDFWTIGAGAFTVVRLGDRFAIPVVLEALVPSRRPTFSFGRTDIVYQPALVSGRAWLGVEYSFF